MARTITLASQLGDLELLDPSRTTQITLRGYWSEYDGGGGLFAWVPGDARPADDGLIFLSAVPAMAGAGRWVRQIENPARLSVRWWGAQGNRIADDWSAFERCIAAAASIGGSIPPSSATPSGVEVEVPVGQYRINGGAAVTARGYFFWVRVGTRIAGATGFQYGGSVLFFDDLPAIGFLIEDAVTGTNPRHARGTSIERLVLYPNNADSWGTTGILVHAPDVTLDRLYVTGCNGTNVWVQSGLVGVVTPGAYMNCNGFEFRHSYTDFAGEYGFLITGSDSNAFKVDTVAALTNGLAGFGDGNLLGGTWVMCQTDGNCEALPLPPLEKYGYENDALSSRSVYVGCYSEEQSINFVQNESQIWGGVMSNYNNAVDGMGLGGGRLRVSRRFGSLRYAFVAPSLYGGSMQWWRDPEPENREYFLGWGPTGAFGADEQFVFRRDPSAIDDAYDSPIAWTDSGHPAGACLVQQPKGTYNIFAHWHFRQTRWQGTEPDGPEPGVPIVIPAGSSVTVPLWFRTATGVPAEPPGVFMAKADPFRPSLVRYWQVQPVLPNAAAAEGTPRLTALSATRVRVGASVQLYEDDDVGNYAVELFNDGADDVTVELLWHFHLHAPRPIEDQPSGVR